MSVITPKLPRHVVEQARIRIRKRAIHHQLLALAAGKSERLSLDLGERGVDVAAAVLRASSGFEPESLEMQRLRYVFHVSGTTEAVIDGLAARDLHRRARSARLVGALRLEESVAWVAPLLASRETSVAEAAARALGRIGGIRSAEALLAAVEHAGPRRVLITELSRAAPDLFVEAALAGSQRPGVMAAAGVAAGLRRRQTGVGPLLTLLTTGNRRQRVISSRALGWIGARTAIPVIGLALQDRQWRVRMSAAKALGTLQARGCRPDLERLLLDRNPRVRKAAAYALRRLEQR